MWRVLFCLKLCKNILRREVWWWYVERMHLSEPCFPEIFRMPRPFSLFTPPNTLLNVLMLLLYLPSRCSLHLRTYDSLMPSTPLTLHLTLSSWDSDIIVSSDLTFWLLSHSLLCVTLEVLGKQGSERRFLPTFIIRSPEATSFWQLSGMFILLELVSQGIMTVSFLARFSKFRPRFSQISPCSSFLFKVFFRLFGYSSCFFRALEGSQKHVSLCDVWLVFSLPSALQTYGPIYLWLLI